MIYVAALILCACLTAFDRFTKGLAVSRLEGQEPFVIVKGVFELNFTRNDGAAFGVFGGGGGRWFFVALTVAILAGLVFFFIKAPSNRQGFLSRVAVVFVVSGALGNFIDRLFVGSVVDFFYFKPVNFPLFNMADIYITCGCVALIIITLFVTDTDKAKGGEIVADVLPSEQYNENEERS